MSDPGARTARAYLAVTAAVVVAAEALPIPTWLEDLAYSLVSASVVVAVLVGVRRHRPRGVRAWYLMAAGQALWVVGDTLFSWQQHVLGSDAFPTLADAFYLLGYPVLAAGLLVLVRGRRGSRRDPGSLLDSATVTAGLCLLSWVLLARPTIESLHHSASAAAVTAAYPAMDILLIGGLIRLVSAPGGRSTAFRYLLLSLLLLVAADTMSVAFDLYGTGEFAAVDYLWLFSYAAWGTAALHPSMTTLSEPVTSVAIRFRGFRLLSVVVAVLIAPGILAMQQVTGVGIDVWAVVVGSVVMFLLVVIRMNMSIEGIVSAHEALEVLQDEMAVLATRDPMTGLPNRTQSMRLLAGALGRSRRRGAAVGLLFIDLDGFKAVNDDHGHRAGDAVLREVARRMGGQVREGDFVGRLGGDEFVLGIEDLADEDDAVALANRLIAAVSAEIQVDETLTVQVGASVGIALGRGGQTDSETLLHEADLAVYQAKAAGRGCVRLFSDEAREALRQHVELERSVARAIDQDELVLHFQPILHVTTGQVECYEALVRWDRPGLGLQYPDQFLPVAESSDLICELDAWVLRAAAAELAAWNRRRGDFALQVAVNISARHVSKTRVLEDVAQALRTRGIIAPQLVIEVTETALMDGRAAASNLELLREMGVIISLDDFGTGYQSSAQLSRLPVDVLKIDRHFVDGSSGRGRSLLELMVKTAHAFGARVVAEGVEHQEQLDLVRALGCEYAQGYFLGKPVPADRVHLFEQAAGLVAGGELAG